MDSLYKKAYNYLLSYGFSPVHKGFKLIIDAVILLCRSKTLMPMQKVYAKTAQTHGISPCSVQKNIKNAIDYAVLNCNIEYFTAEFGSLLSNGEIACGTFLCYAADKLKYK